MYWTLDWTHCSAKCIRTSNEVIDVHLTLHNVDDIIAAIYKCAHKGDFDNMRTDFPCPWSYVTASNRMLQKDYLLSRWYQLILYALHYISNIL